MDLPPRPSPKIGVTRLGGGGSDGGWVATEKLHGANLVVATDGTTVRFGKRRACLEDGEPFSGWQPLRAELPHQVTGLHRLLGSVGVLRVYGEQFGGPTPIRMSR
jgi:hypothetical protein